jgi:RHS repeat-associated protein
MTYDAAGDLTNDGYQSYAYDATGQQTSAGTTLAQSYDGDRLRVKKIENSLTTYYLRSTVLGGQVISELSSSGSLQRGYVYLGSQVLAIQQSNQVSWVHQDPITKSQRVTNSSGTVTSTIDLDPWGGETSRSSNQAFQPHRYTSYERDSNGSDEAMMRRYAGKWHRFAQPDLADDSYDLSNPQSFNRYAYVNNDPVNSTDPSGLLPCTFDLAGNWCVWGGGYDPILNEHGRILDLLEMTNPGALPNIGDGGLGGALGGQGGNSQNSGNSQQPSPTSVQDRLPFNSCAEFVNWFSQLATDAVIRMGVQRNNINFSAKGYGMALAAIAYYGYASHINNGFTGFKGELVNAGEGTPAGRQGAGVYGHILFSSGAELIARAGFAEGVAAYQGNRLKDWGQALFGSSQYQSERAGNIAGKAVGDQLWQYFGGKMSQSELNNNLSGILCE